MTALRSAAIAAASLLSLLAPGPGSAAPAAAPPDVVLFGGKIVTLDARDSIASAVAVRDGRIVAVGLDAKLKKLAGPKTRLVDLGGKTVVPGLIDAHCHPVPTLFFTSSVDARAPGVPSVAQALRNIGERARVTPKGAWIAAVGASSSATKFVEKRLPTRAELDLAAPDNPVWFWNGTHAEVVNSLGLQALGISRENLKLPHGGRVSVDASGEPTGQMFEAEDNVPFAPTAETLMGWLRTEIPALWNAHGFTTLNGMMALDEVAALRKVAASGFLPSIRYSTFVFAEPNGVGMPADLGEVRMPPGAPPDFYRTAGIKLWIDGEVDAGSGYCSQPYADPAGVPDGGRGLQVTTQEEAVAFARKARTAGLAVAFHASCDASSEIAVRAYREAARDGGPRTPRRLEHYGQFVGSTAEVARAVKELDLLVVTQPAWLLFLGKSTYHLLGEERARTGFPYGSMVKAGLKPAGSSDTTGVYLEAVNPFVHMKAAVTRQSDMGVLQPEEALSVRDALRMWTIWAARSIQQEKTRGTLEPGKLADMTVLSDDLLTIDPTSLDKVRVLRTIVGGDVVYEAR
jgi:predicted amidohydrolase YtcJ